MATPDVRVRLSAEGVQEVVGALKKIQSEAATTGKKSASSFNLLGASLNGLKGLLGQVAAAFAIGELFRFGAGAARAADELAKMSQRVGASVKNLGALKVAAELANVGTEQLQTGLVQFNRRAQQAVAGSGEAAAGFKALGVSISSLRGKDSAERLELVARAFGKLKDSPEKSAIALAVFGKQGAALIPLLNDLSEQGLAGISKQMKSLGIVFDERGSAAAQKLNDSFTILKLQATSLAGQFVTGLAPALVEAVKGFSEALGGSGRAADGFKRMGEAVGGLVRLAGRVAEVVLFVLEPILAITEKVVAGVGWLLNLGTKPAPITDKLRGGVGAEAPDMVDSAKAAAEAKRAAAVVAEALKTVQTFVNAGLTAEGRGAAVALTHIAEEADLAKAALEKLRNLTSDQRAALEAQIDKSFETQVAAAELAEKQHRIEADQAAFLLERAAIQRQVETGKLSEAAGEAQILALERQRLPLLLKSADAAIVMAQALGNPELLAALQKQRAELEGLATTSKGVKEVADAFESSLGGALRQVGREIKTITDLLLNFLATFADALAQIFAAKLAKRVTDFFFSGGGQAQSKAEGGMIVGPGTGMSDSIPAMLSNGEFVVRSAIVQQPGMLQALQELNAFGGIRAVSAMRVASIGDVVRPRRFADGGLVAGGGAGGGLQGSLNVNVGLDEGLILKTMESSEGIRRVVRAIASSPRAARRALQR